MIRKEAFLLKYVQLFVTYFLYVTPFMHFAFSIWAFASIFPLPLILPLPSLFFVLPAPDDYQHVQEPVTFSSSTTSHKLAVPILDDNFLEINEQFSVSLTTSDNDILLSPHSARVLIINDDGTCVCLCVCMCVYVCVCLCMCMCVCMC